MKKIKAFTLLEISLVLVMTGLTVAGITSFYKIILISQRNYNNQKKYEYIQASLQNHVIQHGHLPYAAQDNNGIATPNCTAGYLPYKTLGINQSYAQNAEKKAFTYQVNSYLAQTNIPIITPLSYPPKAGETSFNRVYHIQNGEIIFYDLLSQTPHEITLQDKDGSNFIVQEDFFYILPPLPKFSNLNQLYKWQSTNNKTEKFKCSNTIAWALFVNNQHVYFQTRFDISAQIGFYASPEPILIDN